MRKIILSIMFLLMLVTGAWGGSFCSPGQPPDADLDIYAGITPSANMQTFLGSADFAAMRTNLGLAIGTNVQAYNANLAAEAGITGSAYGISYYTGEGTKDILAKGTAYQILQMNSDASAFTWSSSLSISSINMTNSTSSIPWPVGTATWPTTEGAAKWHSTNDALYIGDGATSIILDMTANATYTFPTATATLAPLQKGYVALSAGSMLPAKTAPCAAVAQTEPDPNVMSYMAFDGATDENAVFQWVPPDDWDLSTIKAKFVWTPSSEDNAQTVQWCMRCYAVSDGDTFDVAFSAGEVCAAADALGADDYSAKKQKITAATGAITVQGTPALGDVVHCNIYRDVSGDDYEHDAWLLGVRIEYGKNATPATAW